MQGESEWTDGDSIVETPLAGSNAFFNLQQTGDVYYGTEVSFPGAPGSGQVWTPTTPVTVLVDVSALTEEKEVAIYFDLNHFGVDDSVVVIDDVMTVAPPLAGDDPDVSTDEDTAVAIDVTANDTDLDGTVDATTVTVTSGPSHGYTAVDGGTGVVTYTSALDFYGVDTFTYTVRDNDGNVSNEAVVTVTVNPVNDAPTVAGGAGAVDEDIPFEGTLSASDVESDPLTYTVVTQPPQGTVVLTSVSAGTFTYTPNQDFNGTDVFTFKAGDGTAESQVASYTMTVAPVNDAPVSSDGTNSVDEDTALQGTLAAHDVDQDPLTFQVVDLPAQGTVELTSLSTGAFSYTPAADFFGTDTFTFRVHDALVPSNTASYTIRVNPVNDAPRVSDGEGATDEDEPLSGTLSAFDVEDDPLTFSIVAQGTKGTAVLDDASTGEFTYTPFQDLYGTDTFTFKAADAGADSVPATFVVTIAPVNDPPVTVSDTAETDEDTAVVTVDVLANDSDVEGNILTVASFTPAAHGLVTDHQDGTFTYTPELDFNGIDSFTYTAGDGNGGFTAGTVTVTVNPVNDAPVADAGGDRIVDEEILVTLDGTGTSDVDMETLYYSWVQTAGPDTIALEGADTATPTFTAPNVGPGGVSFTFELTVRDRPEGQGGLVDTDTCIVSVTWLNIPPTADAGADQEVDEGVTVTLDGSGSSDPDDAIKTYQWVQIAGPAVTLSDAGAVSPTFDTPDVGPGGAVLEFKLTVTDSGADFGEEQGLRDEDTCVVTVNWVNIPPTADAGEEQTVDEGDEVTLDGRTSSDPDDGIQTYLWEVIGWTGLTPEVEVALSDPNAVTPTFTAPEVGIGEGAVTFRLTVTDTEPLTDTSEVTVHIENVVIPGDVNDSHAVDLEDAIIVLGIFSQHPVATPITVKADTNADRKIGFHDLLFILQTIAQLRTPG